MKIKTNIRAGAGANAGGVKAGGASGVGHNSTNSTPDGVPPPPPPVYYPPGTRCAGY